MKQIMTDFVSRIERLSSHPCQEIPSKLLLMMTVTVFCLYIMEMIFELTNQSL